VGSNPAHFSWTFRSPTANETGESESGRSATAPIQKGRVSEVKRVLSTLVCVAMVAIFTGIHLAVSRPIWPDPTF
jgi:hypothetical protein